MSFVVSLKRAGIMIIRVAFVFCISFLALPAWAQNCSGKLIGNDICIPKTYQNMKSTSYPNKAKIGVDLKRVILLDIDPKKNKISVHVDLLMQWYENRIELLMSPDVSSRFGGDDATANLWIPNYKIKG